MRGQVETVIILVVLVVAVMVIFYAVQLNSLGGPQISDPAQRLVVESIEGSIRTGTLESLKTVSESGGYTEAQSTISLSGEPVPYWQLNGQNNIPDFNSNLESAILSYISESKPILEQALEGREVVIQDPQAVSVTILPDSIDVAVTMPTTERGNVIPQPYRISIPSRFSEVLDFSSSFLEAQRSERFFETFTLSSMLLSEPEGDTQRIPVLIVLSECGKYVHKSYDEVREDMESIIRRTVAHTYLPSKAPEGIIEVTGYPKYSLTQLNGKEFQDIDVNFWVPDSFSLDRNMLQFTPDPITVRASPLPFTGSCQSEPLYVEYSFNYPVIAKVKDPLTGIPLQFAFNALVINNEAVPYQEIQEQGAAHCANPQCSIDISVTDSSGSPVDNAYVGFIGCGIGETSPSGRLQSQAPCGMGSLTVTKDRFSQHFSQQSSDSIKDISIVLEKRPLINLKFWEVNVREEPGAGGLGQFRVLPGTGRDSDIGPIRDGFLVSLVMLSDTSGFQLAPITYDTTGGVLDMPAGNYVVQGMLFNEETGQTFGSFIQNLEVKESMNGQELNVYLPYTITFPQLQSEEDIFTKTLTLTNLLDQCGLGPISTSPLGAFSGCVKLQGDLLA